MGYFLGQNSPRSAKMATETSAASPAGATDGRPQPAAPAQAAAAADSARRQRPADSARDVTAAFHAGGARRLDRRPGSRASRRARPCAETEAPAGAYWQVMAVQGKSDAAVVVRTLKNKGFPATVSPGTKGLTRVLVGPYPERTALGRAKTDLEAAGFHGLYRVEIGK